MEIEFTGRIWFWKGPAPWYFLTVPAEAQAELSAAAEAVSYGWGMIPVTARIGRTRWKTSLFPKDGSHIVPLKAAVRHAENLGLDDSVAVRLTIGV